jgi:hypothetical protein
MMISNDTKLGFIEAGDWRALKFKNIAESLKPIN